MRRLRMLDSDYEVLDPIRYHEQSIRFNLVRGGETEGRE